MKLCTVEHLNFTR